MQSSRRRQTISTQPDLVIRGGYVVDGLGSEPEFSDVSINHGKITEVGKIESKGKSEFDADGLNVTPGFIDLHTHLDAQIGWDRDLTPVSWHGVTTALMGNCGVTVRHANLPTANS